MLSLRIFQRLMENFVFINKQVLKVEAKILEKS